ncbi:MAG: ribbon-helix-helix domain-containing protein [Pseudanabaenales cyanobacterium]|nr:ribbon-helix-helix domain-containing protein [Pseudanabaenales cyanobacterium]
MATKTISFRLPVELVEAIEAEAKATGQSKTKIVTAILAKFYDYPYDVLPQSITLEQLQKQLHELKHLMTTSLGHNSLTVMSDRLQM